VQIAKPRPLRPRILAEAIEGLFFCALLCLFCALLCLFLCGVLAGFGVLIIFLAREGVNP